MDKQLGIKEKERELCHNVRNNNRNIEQVTSYIYI